MLRYKSLNSKHLMSPPFSIKISPLKTSSLLTSTNGPPRTKTWGLCSNTLYISTSNGLYERLDLKVYGPDAYNIDKWPLPWYETGAGGLNFGVKIL